MRNRRIGKAALLTAALALTASLSVGSALAYFTAYCTAQGSQKMSMGFTTTEVDEDVIDDAKHISITNTGEYDCFVRVRVFAPDDISLEYDEEGGESNWVKKGDYWEYVKVYYDNAYRRIRAAGKSGRDGWRYQHRRGLRIFTGILQ